MIFKCTVCNISTLKCLNATLKYAVVLSHYPKCFKPTEIQNFNQGNVVLADTGNTSKSEDGSQQLNVPWIKRSHKTSSVNRWILISNGRYLTMKTSTPMIPRCISTSSNYVFRFHCFDSLKYDILQRWQGVLQGGQGQAAAHSTLLTTKQLCGLHVAALIMESGCTNACAECSLLQIASLKVHYSIQWVEFVKVIRTDCRESIWVHLMPLKMINEWNWLCSKNGH